MPFKMAQPIEVLKVKNLVEWKFRLSTKNYKPRATGSLSHLMLKVFCTVLKTAPYRLNYSMLLSSLISNFKVNYDFRAASWQIKMKKMFE